MFEKYGKGRRRCQAGSPYPLERNETLSRRANHITTHPECSGSAKRHAYQVPTELDVRPSHCSADVPSRT
jgi:hypothetical protein